MSSLFVLFTKITRRGGSRLLSPVIFLLLCAPCLAMAFFGYFYWDDEGFFLLVSKYVSQGRLLYAEVPQFYGPSTYWCNYIVYSLLGLSHHSSRVATCVLVALTCLLTFKCAKQLFSCRIIQVLVPLFWLYGTAPYLKQGLHPGWYIACLIALQGGLLVSRLSARNWFWQGVFTGVMSGFKLTVASCSGFSLLYLLLRNLRSSARYQFAIWAPFIALWVYIFSRRIVSPRLSVVEKLWDFMPLCPVLLAPLILVMWERGTVNAEKTENHVSWVVSFLGGVSLMTAAIYGVAFTWYGVEPVVGGIIGGAWKGLISDWGEYVFMSVDDRYVMLPLLWTVFCSLILRSRRGLLFRIAAIYWIVLCLKCDAIQVSAGWPFVYALALIKILTQIRKNPDNRDPLPVVFFSLCHFLQVIPVPMIQVCYATPLGHIATFYLLDMADAKSGCMTASRFIKFIAIGLLLVIFGMSLVILWKANNEYEASRLPGMNGIRLMGEDEKEIQGLLGFVNGHSLQGDSFLSLTGQNSLNILVDLPLPMPVVGGGWLISSANAQKEIIQNMSSTRFVSIDTGVPWLGGMLREEGETGLGPLMEYLRENYTEVPMRLWYTGHPKEHPTILFERTAKIEDRNVIQIPKGQF